MLHLYTQTNSSHVKSMQQQDSLLNEKYLNSLLPSSRVLLFPQCLFMMQAKMRKKKKINALRQREASVPLCNHSRWAVHVPYHSHATSVRLKKHIPRNVSQKRKCVQWSFPRKEVVRALNKQPLAVWEKSPQVLIGSFDWEVKSKNI